ncbi:MAG: putative bifunctional diguanylate cyclase/phosphodiesterase [Actinomycetota bacterium]
MKGGRRITVLLYLLAAFAVMLVTLVALAVSTTTTSFERERRRVESELRSAAQREVDLFDDQAEVKAFVEQMAGQPAMAALDPEGCRAVFEGLRGLIDAHVHLVRADGSEVCGLTEERAPDARVDPGPWLQEALATDDLVTRPPAIDPSAHTPAVLSAIRVTNQGVAVGAVVIQLYTGYPPIDQPEGLAPETSIFVVDPERSLVLATTPGQLDLLGTPIDGRPELDGDNIWVETTSEHSGWHGLAVVPKDVALEAANAELRRTLGIGATSVAVLVVLGVVLERRLARPVRRLRQALQASLGGDESARAPVEGPAEVAEAAEVFNDLITERHAREAELAWKAGHDVLTGLPNRAALTEHLDELLAAGTTDLAVLFLDLDRFKLVNDSHGHAVGDKVLVVLGHRLAESLGGGGTLGRFGGDEFVAVCPAIGGEPGARAMSLRLAQALKVPVRFEAQEIWLAGSVGIALVREGDNAEDVIRNADTAMYRAKEAGRGGSAVFDQKMREWSLLRLDLERDLNRAIEREELLLHFQPKIALHSGRLVGFEALVRWLRPVTGMVPPGDFIPVADETGLIVPIGRWVLERAAAESARWRRDGDGAPRPVAVNLSALQVCDPGLPDEVARALAATGALPSDIILEITESAILQDVEGVTERLAALRDAGVRISVDDFGTGYSSLSYLQRLPVDELKIDRSFIERLDVGATRAIVGSIVDLSHALDLSVVAEGIETERQLAALKTLRCDVGQGYLLGRPRPVEVISEMLLLPSSPAD